MNRIFEEKKKKHTWCLSWIYMYTSIYLYTYVYIYVCVCIYICIRLYETIYCTYTPTLKLVPTVYIYIYKMATFLACVCPRKGGLIVFGCLQLLPWRMQFHLSFIFPHLDCIRINCNSSKFSLKFHFVL